MGLPYYFSQALSGVTDELDKQRARKAKQAEIEAAQRSKLLGYQFLLGQQQQAQESAERRDLERAKREALLEGIKRGDERSGRLYDEIFGFQAEAPPADFGRLAKASQAERGTLPEVIVQGEASPAFVGPLQSAARTTFAKDEAERQRKLSDLDLEREYKQQQMLESQSRIRENEANIVKMRALTNKKVTQADLKDNINTVKIALDTMAKERNVLSQERNSLLRLHKGRVPPEQQGRLQQIERRLTEIDTETAVKQRRLDSLREGFEVPPIKPGRLAGAHESYYLITQMIGRRALAPDLAKKLVQDGRAKSIIEARAQANEYITTRDAVRHWLEKNYDMPEGTDIEDQVDLFLANNPNIKAEQLR